MATDLIVNRAETSIQVTSKHVSTPTIPVLPFILDRQVGELWRDLLQKRNYLDVDLCGRELGLDVVLHE